MDNIKVTQCKGEGQGTCKICNNRNWMCFLYKIEGYEGCYCSDCISSIKKKNFITFKNEKFYIIL